MKRMMIFVVFCVAAVSLTALSIGEAWAQEVWKYDVWFSVSMSDPPHTPSHDCWTVTSDGSSFTLESEGFGASGPLVIQPGYLGVFIAAWPGFDQIILGWFLNGGDLGWPLARNTIGGVMSRYPKTWAFEGVLNPNCVFDSSE